MRPPWVRKASPLFPTVEKPKEDHKRYNSRKWQKASSDFFRGKVCEHIGCIMLAYCTDHIIPISKGGSQWDRRNWQRLCRKHHDMKRAHEARGKIEEKIGTKYGYIPKRRENLPPDIVGQSCLIKDQ